MRVDHIFGGHIYVISNYSVALNPLFWNNENCEIFQKKVTEYLGPLCEIMGYGFCDNQFQLLIRTFDRSKFAAFYRQKKSEAIFEDYEIPETGLIFSQEVSNLLNSFAKHFNFRYQRRGGLFAARYSKYLVETEDEMRIWLERINGLKKLVDFSEEWDVKGFSKMDGASILVSSKKIYEKRPFEEGLVNEDFEGEVSPGSIDERRSELDDGHIDVLKDQSLVTHTDRQDVGASEKYSAGREVMNDAGVMNDLEEIEGGEKCYLGNFVHLSEIDLRGCFRCLPPGNYKTQNFLQFWGDFYSAMEYPPPW